jgi:pilus assembly protein CpaC
MVIKDYGQAKTMQLKLSSSYILLFIVTLLLTPSLVLATDSDKFDSRDLPVTEIIKGRGQFLKLEEAADAVFISNPEVADVEIKFANMLYVFGKSSGETTLHVLNENGDVMVRRSIVVTANMEDLHYSFTKLLPDSNIEIFAVKNKIALRGEVESPEAAKTAMEIAKGFSGADGGVINMLNIKAPNQITLRVKIAEVSRNVSKQLGVNWQSGGANGSISWGVLSKDAPLQATEFLQQLAQSSGGSSSVLSSGVSNLNLSSNLYQSFLQFSKGKGTLDLLFDALESEGSLTTLAEPSLTAVSGEQANFLAGGEFPIIVPDPQTGFATTEFKNFGISLEFTPTLLTENRIRLTVKTSVSNLDSSNAVQQNGFSIPGISNREANTVVELGDGQSLTIGGLYQHDMQDNIRVPNMSDRLLHGQTLTDSIKPINILGQSTKNITGDFGFSIK